MKEYPSIPNAKGQKFENLGLVDVFDKLDGNNLRFEWSKKRGWYKAGSRTQMIDANHEQFGAGVRWFMENTAEWIPTCFKKAPQKLVVFGEWYGEKSFAGQHEPGDELRFAVFDVCVDNRGFMDPKEFRKTFEGSILTPEWLGQFSWSRQFVDSVFHEQIDGVSFEGVVGKTMSGSVLKMGKAKTRSWYEKLSEKYNPETAAKLADS